MRLPSKVTPYKQSILQRFMPVLKALKKKPMTPPELFSMLDGSVKGVGDFVEVLDCLYALTVVELDDKDGLLRYVD